RLGIPSWTMTDGPHGLRKQSTDNARVGLHDSVPATCFPSGAGLASTWNVDLVEEVGKAIGAEAKAEGVGVVLGPAINIKRSPLCGRNFEYLSEDPLLAGELARHYITGLQSSGVGASIKHFAANNQEKNRMFIDVVADERTLREIYLPAFETAIRGAKPWTVMCAYNRINGTYCSENEWLLSRVLRDEWGYKGIVVTDWGACDDRVAGLLAGEDFVMPGDGGITDAAIVAAVEDGSLSENCLDAAVRRILDVTFRVVDAAPVPQYDAAAHHALARRVATESMVLLKNEPRLLPLGGFTELSVGGCDEPGASSCPDQPPEAGRRIVFVGAFARTPRYQGGGSSHIVPTRMDDALEEARSIVNARNAGNACRARAGNGSDREGANGAWTIDYAPGYRLDSDEPDPTLLAEARGAAARADTAVLFIGLTDRLESEGFDRNDMKLPQSHLALLEEVLKVQKNVVVVLSNGAPVEMPWMGRVPAIIEGYLGGQAWGGAIADILFGLASPSGRLTETFPRRLEDNPSYLNFPGDAKRVEYREGIFVGYRYYDAARVEPLFPFGHGLSYTEFEYSNLRLDKAEMQDTDSLTVQLDVRNVGLVESQEVVQLYVEDEEASVLRPPRELKGFCKVTLKPGEKTTVEFELSKRAFAFWSEEHEEWVVETGDFVISVGASSRDIRLRASVRLESSTPDLRVWDSSASLGEVGKTPAGAAFARTIKPRFAATFGNYAPGSAEAGMMEAMMREMPLRNLVRMGGQATQDEIDKIIATLNKGKGKDET
ncbi:MAG: glycoside hydrolase family 3 C-terminal domain-containing protein, partial [Spirochaetaceae bacterium]|nr:glycoside hydrolase family 3 C-terminal domain-containing protein [Spirochaetaceae bacterium]